MYLSIHLQSLILYNFRVQSFIIHLLVISTILDEVDIKLIICSISCTLHGVGAFNYNNNILSPALLTAGIHAKVF